LDTIQHNLSKDINSLASWFKDNELIINLEKGKTEVMQFETAKRLSGFNGKRTKPFSKWISYRHNYKLQVPTV